ncbi:MAG TPA: hypothetical protein VEJ44_02505, partial [Acidimicrobiales bacterium]|nr:hypothetical protein [Acidimicrobiales bacterium]
MRRTGRLLVLAPPPHGPAYDIVLLAHILAVIAAFGAVVTAGASALSLARPGPPPERVVRYYRPGVNWAGRVVFLVPVLGVVLMALSKGAWTFADGWILIGLVLWVVAASLAEMVLWPTERRLQEAVARLGDGSEGSGGSVAPHPDVGPG